MNTLTKYMLSGLMLSALAFVGVTSTARAQTAAASPSISACYNFSTNLYYGLNDYGNAGNVTALQSFLSAQGYFNYPAIDIFGPLTFKAVVSFQSAHGIPGTGFVGPLTRAAIAGIGCGTTPPSSGVSIYSINPASGPIGTTITITGFAFTPTGNIVHFGMGAIGNIPSSGGIAIACTTDPNCHGGIRQTLIITVPSSIGPYCPPGAMCPMYLQEITAPGTYNIYVQNANGTSNSIPFNVTTP